jgi:cysteinyl-tRNA synthetase
VKIFDSKAQSLVDFEPITPGQVSIYVCGPTVQSAPHVGHLRSAVSFDIIARWLRIGHGLSVKLVRNVTDIDDKILVNALEQGRDWRELAIEVEAGFNEVYESLGAGVEYSPHATDHIPGMIAFIERLIERGHAYAPENGTANVFFDTASYSSYGELTNQKLENMEGEAIGGGRRAAHDFALWKSAKPGEPESASWDSPWGKGRPGWHIECSAMTLSELGSSFDIHGGGLDLRFPHHENELAQSRAAGYEFASHWMHNGLVTVSGTKMSKSLGNGVSVEELFAEANPVAVRYWLASAHYRSTLDYSPTSIAEAVSAVGRIINFVRRAAEIVEASNSKLPNEFVDAMDADFNVPVALGVLHETVRAGNTSLDSGDLEAVGQALSEVTLMANVLGIDLAGNEKVASAETVELIEGLIAKRNQARANKDYALADLVRAELMAMGVTIEDQADKTAWMWSN